MAFKTVKINERSPRDYGERLVFDLKVNISQNGLFTAYIPENIITDFESAGISLECNPARRSKAGFFAADTLHGLIEKVQGVITEYFSTEKVQDKLVIKYIIQTTCEYSINSADEITPNCCGKWAVDSEEMDWHRGTVEPGSFNSHPYGIAVYAEVFRKQTFRYKSGKEYVDYKVPFDDKIKDGSFVDKLSSFVRIGVPHNKEEDDAEEIDCTEDAAEFFLGLLTSICRLNENIKNLLDPKSILELIQNKQKLLPNSTAKSKEPNRQPTK